MFFFFHALLQLVHNQSNLNLLKPADRRTINIPSNWVNIRKCNLMKYSVIEAKSHNLRQECSKCNYPVCSFPGFMLANVLVFWAKRFYPKKKLAWKHDSTLHIVLYDYYFLWKAADGCIYVCSTEKITFELPSAVIFVHHKCFCLRFHSNNNLNPPKIWGARIRLDVKDCSHQAIKFN